MQTLKNTKVKIPWLPIIGISIIIVVEVIAYQLVDNWKAGGPDIFYWLGNVINGCLWSIVGIVFIFRAFRQSKRKLVTLVFGATLTILGILALFNVIWFISMGCPAPGCYIK
jgi:hypothetical protein